MSPALAGLSGLLAFLAAWELAGLGLPRMGGRRVREWIDRLARGPRWVAGGESHAIRLRRAGLDGRLSPRGLALARLGGIAASVVLAIAVLPATPVRLAPVLAIGLLCAGLAAPEALLERAIRRRSAAIVSALPDALDLLAVGAAAGRSLGVMLAEVARASRGPLAVELASAAAEIEAGSTQQDALARLRTRSGVAELGHLAATLERSRRFGSPLADQLHARAAALRAQERRRIAEHAARAAPKIQLAVALLLVPSALLAITAALIAHADSLFQALR